MILTTNKSTILHCQQVYSSSSRSTFPPLDTKHEGLSCSRQEFFLSGGPSSSAEVRVVVIHDIKEVEGERQQEVQEDKGDEEIGSEVDGEVEEDHSTCA